MLRPFYQSPLVVLQIRMQTDSQPRHNDRELAAYTGECRRDGFIAHLIHLTMDNRSANPLRKIHPRV